MLQLLIYIKYYVQEDLDTIIKEVDRVLTIISLEFPENDIIRILNDYSKKISIVLVKQKSRLYCFVVYLFYELKARHILT